MRILRQIIRDYALECAQQSAAEHNDVEPLNDPKAREVSLAGVSLAGASLLHTLASIFVSSGRERRAQLRPERHRQPQLLTYTELVSLLVAATASQKRVELVANLVTNISSAVERHRTSNFLHVSV